MLRYMQNSPGHLKSAVLALWLGSTWPHARAAESAPKPPDLYGGYSTTQLPDGQWLIAGGQKGNGTVDDAIKARLFNPRTGLWTNTGNLTTSRLFHRATLLQDGKVLVTGGSFEAKLNSAELYDPATRQWTATTAMKDRRTGHVSVRLADGNVLVAGGTGVQDFKPLTQCEIYNPTTREWKSAGSLNVGRTLAAAALMTNGQVLIAGRYGDQNRDLWSAELFNPADGKWRLTGEMPVTARYDYSAEVLTNGQVLLTTTHTNAWEDAKELFDPLTEKWKAVGPRRPHFVSSTKADRTLTILPGDASFLASQQIQVLLYTEDSPGVSNIILFRDGVKVAESETSPIRYELTNAAAGTYVFRGEARFANGLSSTSATVRYIFTAPGPEIGMAPGPSEFQSSPYFNTSPAILRVSLVGINPEALVKLTLNGVEQTRRMGDFTLEPPIKEGKNTFVLSATDNQGRTISATNDVYLKSTAPQLSITRPTNGSSFAVSRVNVAGTFSDEALDEITVNGQRAFIQGKTFELRNVFLQPGTNFITAVATDTSGNVMTNRIQVMGPTETNAYLVDIVQLQATPAAGFAPLTVTLKVNARVPGELKRVVYDFDGDRVPDRTERDLKPVTVTFKEPGQRVPVVTLETTAGEFSSIAEFSWFFQPMHINVEATPVIARTIAVADPVDLKTASNGVVYVLSGNPATLTQFDTNGKALRSLKALGAKPAALEVDEAGNVYVALSGANQVWKFKPTANSFVPDGSFGNGGFIGNKDGTAGIASNQFNAPSGLALTPYGQLIVVSDSGNNRLLRFTTSGQGRGWIGGDNTNWVKFSEPKGIAFDEFGHLFTVDSGSNRVAVTAVSDMGSDDDVLEFGASGRLGPSPGEFNAPTHLSLSERGLCVADTGNNRIQLFEHQERPRVPLPARIALGKELNLKAPGAAAWTHSFLEELLYIADTGNGRVLLVRLPTDSPAAVWTAMKEAMMKGDVEKMAACFTSHAAPQYRQTFLTADPSEMRKIAEGFPPIQPVIILRHEAQYRFDQVIQGTTITFPVQFYRESGGWKIDQY